MKNVLALAVAAIALSTAPVARASQECNDTIDEQLKKYTGMIKTDDGFKDTLKKDGQAIADLLPAFKTAREEYTKADEALQQHLKKQHFEPSLFNGGTEPQKQEYHTWAAEESRLKTERDAKMPALQAALNRLGDPWGGAFGDWGYVGWKRLQNVRDVLGEVFFQLDDADTPRNNWTSQINTILFPPEGQSDYARMKIELPLDTGLMETWDNDREKQHDHHEGIIEYERRCPNAPLAYRMHAEASRTADAATITNDQNRGSVASTGATTATTGITGDLASLIGESPTTSTTGAASSGTTTAAAASTSGGTSVKGNDQKVTVVAGDNLWSIAKGLASKFKGIPTEDLVRALYANLQSKSRNNPNMIFPGDTIDLKAVAKDLKTS